MTPKTNAHRIAARRLLARTSLVLTLGTLLVVAYAGTASADVPEGWRDSAAQHVSLLRAFLVLGGIPLAVIVVIALVTYLPSILRGESVAPAGARTEGEWFGGRGDASLAIESAKTSEETGGASGSW